MDFHITVETGDPVLDASVVEMDLTQIRGLQVRQNWQGRHTVTLPPPFQTVTLTEGERVSGDRATHLLAALSWFCPHGRH
jgi:hypothetical protein